MGAVNIMDKIIRNNNTNGVSKGKIEKEFEQLNQQIRMVEQKLAVYIDRDIISRFQQLDNEVAFTIQSVKRIRQQVNIAGHEEEKTNDIQKTALV